MIPLLHFSPTPDNWCGEAAGLLGFPGGLGRGMANSVIVALATALLSAGMGLIAATGLLRRWRDWRDRQPILPLVAIFLLPRLIPPDGAADDWTWSGPGEIRRGRSAGVGGT